MRQRMRQLLAAAILIAAAVPVHAAVDIRADIARATALGVDRQVLRVASSRLEVTVPVLLLTPRQPKAIVVLLTGGEGRVGIHDDGSIEVGGNFLVRSRYLFAERGLLTAVVDVPSDRYDLDGNFRTRPEHAADLAAVIAVLKQRAKVPVWLIGTSRGTTSAAAVALMLGKNGVDGLVLTSSITNGWGNVPGMALDQMAVPTLVVHHLSDSCKVCAPTGAKLIVDRLVNAPRRQFLGISDGSSVGDACGAWAYHGYNGREADVVSAITDWISPP